MSIQDTRTSRLMGNFAQPCLDFARTGICWTEGCNLQHEDNISFDRVAEKEHDWTASTEVGEACGRCLRLGLECDKLGRDDKFDPCSQCRHFGGDCNCKLRYSHSYNSKLWDVMMKRLDSFTLPQIKKEPKPMPFTSFKDGWVGESLEDLLAKPDFLPAGMRACPRKYLTVPHTAAASAQRALEQQQQLQHLAVSGLEATIMSSGMHGDMPRLPSMPLIPSHPIHGDVVLITYAPDTTVWTFQYRSGFKCSGLADQRDRSTAPQGESLPFRGTAQSQHDAEQADASASSIGIVPMTDESWLSNSTSDSSDEASASELPWVTEPAKPTLMYKQAARKYESDSE